MFKHVVHAKYQVVEASLPDLVKKAILPALMLLGPVACGTGGGEHENKRSGDTHKAETKVEQGLSSVNIDCEIKSVNDGTVWTFKGANRDYVQLKLPADEKAWDRNTIEVLHDPSTPSMDRLKEALLDTFSDFDLQHMQKKYECQMEPRNLPGTAPKVP